MIVNVLKNENVLTLKLEGRIDTTTAPILESHINELPAETTSLIIDLEQINYISSAGLRVLLSAQKKMNKIGTKQT